MSDEDKTPTDGKTTLDLVFTSLGELRTDTKQALKESREANLMSGQNNELLKKLVARSQPSGLVRASLPYAAVFIALIAILRTL